MSINAPYKSPAELPQIIPIFPLPGVLMLPRGELPLNIFEPRYLVMVDDVLRSHRLVGMIQPNTEAGGSRNVPALFSVGCAGRITQFAETGDGRIVITLTGVARYRLREEMPVVTPYRQAQVEFEPFADDFMPGAREDAVDRAMVLKTLDEFAESNHLKIDWKSIESASNEALVNALSMMSPFGPKEKQALLEAADLKARAEVLVAITQMELARSSNNTNSIQ
ncbi:MAG: LON peptidase substrate-binding domain-containing protein [Beijerinckiaceae bacterium]